VTTTAATGPLDVGAVGVAVGEVGVVSPGVLVAPVFTAAGVVGGNDVESLLHAPVASSANMRVVVRVKNRCCMYPPTVLEMMKSVLGGDTCAVMAASQRERVL
jgi:hypothetical protein